VTLPRSEYKVFDKTWLDDLELWSRHQGSQTVLSSASKRECFRKCLPREVRIVRIEAYRGNIDSSSVGVLCHILLGEEKQDTAFLYCERFVVALAVPESFFISGDLTQDAQRIRLARNTATATSVFFGLSWEFASYGGNTVTIEDEDAFWRSYIEELYCRFEHG